MRFLFLLMLVSLSSTLFSQEARFEAAAIKPVAYRMVRPDQQGPNDGRIFSVAGEELLGLIARAYDPFLVDAPNLPFLRNSYYSVTAEIPAGVGRGKIPEMLRNLLMDRFALVAHTEEHTVKGYTLSLTDVSKLRANAGPDEGKRPPWYNPNDSEGRDNTGVFLAQVSSSQIARLLKPVVGAPVEDKTGLGDDKYTVWVKQLAGSPGGLAPEVVESLSRYGLKLRPATITVTYVVVETINKTPTEN